MKTTSKAALLTMITAAFGFAGNNKLSPDLQSASPDGQVDVIVHYKVQPQARHHARVAQMGGTLKRTLEVVSSAAYTTPAARLQDVASDPDVDYITPDRRVQGMLDYAEPTTNANIALQYGWDGTGVTVAVIDSGIIDVHPDLFDSSGKSRVVYSEIGRPAR